MKESAAASALLKSDSLTAGMLRAVNRPKVIVKDGKAAALENRIIQDVLRLNAIDALVERAGALRKKNE